jgi:hypothetical protein
MPAVLPRLTFSAVRKGSVIGSHDIRFERNGDDLLVRTDVRMKVGLGPIVLFRYRHQAVERWRGSAFVSVETTTDENGTKLRLSATCTGDRVDINSSKLGRITMPGDALPLSHWNVRCMSVPVFNPQDGTLLDGAVTRRGVETVALADGRRVRATRYSKAGADPIDNWYDEAEVWCHLRAVAKDGSLVVYQRTA